MKAIISIFSSITLVLMLAGCPGYNRAYGFDFSDNYVGFTMNLTPSETNTGKASAFLRYSMNYRDGKQFIPPIR